MSQHREPTLADVAARAGVSLTTVSRVLNNRGYLSQETRDKVAEAITALNYRPNQVARALHGKSTRTIGVVVPTVALPFFGELAAELEDALADRGYRTLICNSLQRSDREREYLDLLVSHRVDGIISSAHNDVAEWASIRMPVVTVDRRLSPAVPDIRCDNELGGRLATEHLLSRGSQRPALLTSRTGGLREAGYRAACEAAGVEPCVVAVDFHTPTAERAGAVARALDAVSGSIDAVFATDDLAAAEVCAWAEERRLCVPEGLRVVGFDGTTALRRALPGLTTVRQPIRDIARAAVERVLAMVAEGPDAGSGAADAGDVVLPVKLLQGWTS